MDTSILSTLSVSQDREEFTNRLYQDALGALTMYSIYLGHHLGFYKALAGGEALTSQALAQPALTQERKTRQWHEQQSGSCAFDAAHHTRYVT